MSRLRHRTGAGYTYFVTSKTWQNRALFRTPEVTQVVLEQIVRYRDEGKYLLHSFVVMPDHLHVLLTPSPETTLERAMQFIKGSSSHRIHKERGHKMAIWQAGFHDWTVRNEEDFLARIAYIHSNPVRAPLVEKPEDWPYSSAGGQYPLDPMPEALRRTSVAKAPETPSRGCRS